jgi:hypothetical protein
MRIVLPLIHCLPMGLIARNRPSFIIMVRCGLTRF